MIPSTHQQVRDTINLYLKNRVSFRFIVQNDTISVESKSGSYTTRNADYTIPEINFIKAVKQHIKKNNLAEPFRDQYAGGKKSKHIMYFRYHPKLKPGMKFTDVVNIDITAAYWETAWQFGLLREDLYKHGKTYEKAVKQGLKEKTIWQQSREGKIIRKQVRLAAIGSLAKKQRIYEYNGETKKQKLVEVRRSDATEFLWDAICDHVGTVLMDIAKACGDDFIFFWVDGIYVKKGSEKKVCSMFKKYGYDYKINKISAIEVDARNIHVKLDPPEIKIVNGKQVVKESKPFPFRNNKIAGEFQGYNTDL